MMSKRARKGAVLVLSAGVAAAAVVTATTGAVQAKTEPKAASVTGSGEFRMTFLPEDDKDHRFFTFDVRQAPFTHPRVFPGGATITGSPNDATGTVRVKHHFAAGKRTFYAIGQADSLITSPGYATITAKIVKTWCVEDTPTPEGCEGPPWVGMTKGFSVYDAGRDHGGKPGRSKDRIGMSWEYANMLVNPQGETYEPDQVGTAMAPAPFAPVLSGGFTVVHKDLAVPSEADMPQPPEQ
ncbi:hypothetical protein GWI34_03780 [Actinomadura sp. DSM 109109]|nr:hypothetical protein [Actinomadura lepetitiana]